MRCIYFVLFSLLLAAGRAHSQEPITYFLPDIDYDPAIPSPETYFGFQIGERHISHDQQLAYLRALAAVSPRLTLTQYAATYEQRPLIYLTITSEDNHRNLESIREQHLRLSDPDRSAEITIERQPLVLYQGFSIHGNEPSGGNAAPLVAYYLTAGRSPEVEQLLREVVILLDPCFNPDGFQRFSSWVNSNRNKNLATNPVDREFDEPWPGGRTNHYWFDLNRDWLLQQHPESRGRVELFHDWKPNILTDHHEMGSNSTFFFMPGEPTRTHPLTPPKNQELTARIGRYHAEALDAIGSLYYSGEGYDDFYYGKGSTYPDANGGVGILFEQASSRGHARQTDNGLLTFPFTIRNQVATALSTQRAAVGLRTELLEYQRQFYQEARRAAAADATRAFVFGEPYDQGRLQAFLEVLRRHQLDIFHLARQLKSNGHTFEPESSYVVPLEQDQYRMARAIFDTMVTFEDSIFYDISSWTLPLAFNIPYAALNGTAFSSELLGNPVAGLGRPAIAATASYSDYAYCFNWDEYYAPRALNYLQQQGLRAKVATKPFTLAGQSFSYGAIMVPVAGQGKSGEEIHQLVQIAGRATGLPIYGASTGFTEEGIDLGSRDFELVEQPKVLLLTGEGVSSYEAGEVWHLLDQRYDMVVTKADITSLRASDLHDFNVLVMVNGNYSELSNGTVAGIKDWVANGGTLVATRNAVRWVKDKGLGYVTFREEEKMEDPGRRPYGKLREDNAAGLIGGAIFSAQLDLSHPLAYGYRRAELPVFRNSTLFLEPAKNPYATPLIYDAEPLLSGYISDKNTRLLAGSAAAVVTGSGRGKVICLTDNPNFRAFWYGTNKIFANAVFFGRLISNNAREQAPKNGKE